MANQSSKPVSITIQAGLNFMGSRNVVVFGSGSGSDAATNIKDAAKAQQAGRETDASRDAGRKRRAKSVSSLVLFSFY